MTSTFLVRYGAVPEVARCRSTLLDPPERGQRVLIQTRRGLELGTVLEHVRVGSPLTPAQQALQQSFRTDDSDNATQTESAGVATSEEDDPLDRIVRLADAADEEQREQQVRDAQQEFGAWSDRIREWGLELELIDLEWTFDRARLILYVLGGRGAETTKLALQAAASGFGTIEVQPLRVDDRRH